MHCGWQLVLGGHYCWQTCGGKEPYESRIPDLGVPRIAFELPRGVPHIPLSGIRNSTQTEQKQRAQKMGA